MQKVTFLLCLALYVTLSSSNCNKKSSPEPTNDTYQPTTAGSEWNYTTTGTTGGTPVNTLFKLSASSRDSVTGIRTYRVFTNSIGPNEYYNKTGNDYFRISSFAGLSQSVDLLYLKDNLAVGGTWQESKSFNVNISGFGNVPVTIVTNFTIVEKGGSLTVNSITFNDVIKVNATIAITALGSPVPVDPSSLIQYYYAKNVGMINNKVLVKVPLASIDLNTETKLGAYTIK
jgi:hypothetical protein